MNSEENTVVSEDTVTEEATVAQDETVAEESAPAEEATPTANEAPAAVRKKPSSNLITEIAIGIAAFILMLYFAYQPAVLNKIEAELNRQEES